MKTPHRAFGSILLSLALVLSGGAMPARADDDAGVIIMAQTGSPQWVKMVKKAVKDADIPYPYRIFFGLGDTVPQRRELQGYVKSLESGGAHTIYVVPLLVSTYSATARQWKYLFGVDFQPGYMNNPLFPLQKSSTVRFAEPLNDSAVVVEILLDRAQEISSDPSKEAVVIVALGPNDNSDNERWSQIVQGLAGRLQERGRYKSVEGVILREDAVQATRQRALEYLRNRVKAADQAGLRALVVTLLLAPGGIEHKIGLELRGFNYAFNTKTLLPDSRISEWIRSNIQ